jgi:antirestriction protein ArdC
MPLSIISGGQFSPPLEDQMAKQYRPGAGGTVDETITKMFIEKIEERRAAGETVTAPWRKLWNPALGADRNLATGHAYRGSNVFMTAIQGFASPFWVTAKQCAKLGGTINTEERDVYDRKTKITALGSARVPYTPIVLWVFPDEAQKKAGRFPFVRFYQVWNLEQTTGLEEFAAGKLEADTGEPVNPIEEAQGIVDGWHGCPPISYGDTRAYYTPGTDKITMPDMQAFASAEAFYSTLFHEMAHATGHRSRLDREGVANPARFASHDYSAEELIAEMTAGMLAGHAGINTDEIEDNSAAYLDHWLTKLKADPSMLTSSGGKAQKASDLIRGIKWANASKDEKDEDKAEK